MPTLNIQKRQMRYTNARFTETAHSTFRISERIQKVKIFRKGLGVSHLEISLSGKVHQEYGPPLRHHLDLNKRIRKYFVLIS